MKSLKKYTSPLILVAASVIWGLAFVAQDSASDVPPFTLGAARSILAAIFLMSLIPIIDKTQNTGRRLFSKRKLFDFTKPELIGGAISGVALAFASVLQQMGINSGTAAGKAAFITTLYVVIVPIYGLFLKNSASARVWISVAIALVGFYLLCIEGDFTIAPSDFLVLLCAFVFPIQILAIDRFSPRSDGVRMSCVQFFFATLVNLIFVFILETPVDFQLLSENVLPILYLGIGSSGVAYTLQIIGQRGTNPAAASVILSLEAVFGVLGAAIILSQNLSLREYAGSAIVFVAVLLIQIDFKALFKRRKTQ